MRKLAKYIGGIVGMVALVGCALSDDPGAESQGLQFAVTDTTVEGTFTHEGLIVRFAGVQVESGAVEVEVVLRGMTLTATVEPSGAMDLDAFANENGQDTRMTDEDLVVLRALLKAMTHKMDHRTSAMENFLLRTVKLWSNFPGRQELDRFVLGQEGRSYSSLCGYVGQYWYSTHDGPWLVGCNTDNWADKTSYYGLLGAHANGPCNDGTYFWTGSYWSCYEPDHSTSIEYAYGGCFGQCGDGCGSPDYTVDCANHDSCVRFGHSLAAVSCDDEFSFTVDDFGFSPICY